MPRPTLGLLLTNLPDEAALVRALRLAGAEALAVIPAWGLDGGWTPARIAFVAHLVPTLIVRTTWGDPSCRLGDGEDRTYPYASRVVAELAPWAEARGGDFTAIIGNEPLLDQAVGDLPTPEGVADTYGYHLDAAITAVRQRWPQARIIGPAHTRDHPIPLGRFVNGQRRWDEICGPALRRCDALGLHAYSASQAVAGLHELRDTVSATLPIWLTEFALDEALPPVERARRSREILDPMPIAGVLLYHLCATPGETAMHFNPNYQLDDATLAALGGAGAPPDTVVYQERIGGFTMAAIQWRTVAAFRRHLSGYRVAAVAPWAQGVTLHCTESPLPADWRGIQSILNLARFYRDTRKWTAGPHLYTVSGAPNPLHDGIWQLTPLDAHGVHAASFNATRWGLEVVDNPATQRWDAGTSAFALGALAALHDWAGWEGVTPATLNGHRDDPKTDKTCPGAAIDLAAVRRGVAALRQA